ncbi:MAG: carboxypeptidase regulatory-like domain-containing protein [Gemmatimonadaceae bacterium]
MVAPAVALSLAAPGVSPAQGPRFSSVRGTVFDSVGRSALPGAMVQFLGISERAEKVFATTSDSLGDYRIDSLPPGTYLAGFFHAATDSMGVESTPRRVQVRAGPQDVELATPSAASLIHVLCGAGAPRDSTALLLGHVLDATTDAPITGARVRVEWMETTIGRTGVRSVERADSVTSRASGFFSICGLPADLQLLARVSRGVDSTGYVEVDLPLAGVRHYTFYVGGGTRITAAASGDSTASPVTVLRGKARLTGTVRDLSGDVVPGARAVILGTGVEGLANTVGAFVMDSLPSGSFMLEVRMIGYTPVRRMVQLRETLPSAVLVELGARVFTLPTEVVRGELIYSRQLAGFERRRRTHFTGRFLTPREIQLRPRTRLSWLLEGMPGLVVTRRGPYTLIVVRRVGASPGLEYCGPSLYIDGLLDQTGDFDRLWSDDIAAVEVYARPTQRPFEFTDRNECGAIAVWSRPRSSG